MYSGQRCLCLFFQVSLRLLSLSLAIKERIEKALFSNEDGTGTGYGYGIYLDNIYKRIRRTTDVVNALPLFPIRDCSDGEKQYAMRKIPNAFHRASLCCRPTIWHTVY